MLELLREAVLKANLELVRSGLVVSTFGNASGIDRESGLVAIKPSGVPYDRMTAGDLVITDLDGKVVEGSLRPSSDLETHLILYRAFESTGGVVHTHSRFATAWAQARRELPCLGTTHADYFHGAVPVTEELTAEQIERGYEAETGHAIVRCFEGRNPAHMPAVLVAGHGPFCWGKDAAAAAHNAMFLEESAHLTWLTLQIDPRPQPLAQCQLDKHFLRKHGPKASYGQEPANGPREC